MPVVQWPAPAYPPPHASQPPIPPTQKLLFCCMLWFVLQSQVGMCLWRGKGALDMPVSRCLLNACRFWIRQCAVLHSQLGMCLWCGKEVLGKPASWH